MTTASAPSEGDTAVAGSKEIPHVSTRAADEVRPKRGGLTVADIHSDALALWDAASNLHSANAVGARVKVYANVRCPSPTCGDIRSVLLASWCHNITVHGRPPVCRSCKGRGQFRAEHRLSAWLPSAFEALVVDAERPYPADKLSRFHRGLLRWRCLTDATHSSYLAQVPRLRVGQQTPDLPRCPSCRSLAVADPEIAADWHPTQNGTLAPADVSVGESHTPRWWRCAAGHEWETTVGLRTGPQRTGCPECGHHHTSRPEIALWAEIASVLDPDLEAPGGDVTVEHSRRLPGVEAATRPCDILVMYKPILTGSAADSMMLQHIGIEYDGAYHHRGRHSEDLAKRASITAAGHILIRVREEPLSLLHSADVPAPPRVGQDPVATFAAAAAVLVRIARLPGFPDRARARVAAYLSARICVGVARFRARVANQVLPDLGVVALAATHPDLLDRWGWERNQACTPFHPRAQRAPGLVLGGRGWPWPGAVSPNQIRADCARKVWWRCPIGDWYPAAPRDIVGGRGCPFCAGKQVNDRNCLSATHPVLAAECDPDNPATRRSVNHGSSVEVPWVCSACGHTWSKPVKLRVRAPRCTRCRHDPTA